MHTAAREGENLHGHSAAEDGGNSQISAVPAENKRNISLDNGFIATYLGSQAAIMFLASNICWVSSGTVRALNFKVSKRVPRNKSSYCCRNVTANYHLLCKCYTVCFCLGGEGGFRGKSMEKFWIRSAGRNLLSHDNRYIRVASLQGGKDLCYWTRPPSEFLFFSIFCGS